LNRVLAGSDLNVENWERFRMRGIVRFGLELISVDGRIVLMVFNIFFLLFILVKSFDIFFLLVGIR
jgi:hypothetical protein